MQANKQQDAGIQTDGGARKMERPKVGIAAICINSEGKVLVGLRQGSHGADTVALPGGHLEGGEEWDTCAHREVEEETGLKGARYRGVVATTNDVFEKEMKHYITINVILQFEGDPEPERREKDKCKWWEFKSWDWLRNECENKFVPLANLLKEHPNIEDEVREATK